MTPTYGEILYRIDIRKHGADHKLLVAEGRVIARGIERTTVGSLLVLVVGDAERRH